MRHYTEDVVPALKFSNNFAGACFRCARGEVGRCRLTVSTPESKARLVSALETENCWNRSQACFQSQRAALQRGLRVRRRPRRGVRTGVPGGAAVRAAPGAGGGPQDHQAAGGARRRRGPDARHAADAHRRARHGIHLSAAGRLGGVGGPGGPLRRHGGAVQAHSIKTRVESAHGSAIKTRL